MTSYPWYQRTVSASCDDSGGTCDVILRVKPVIDEDSRDRWLRDNKDTDDAQALASIDPSDPSPAQVELCGRIGVDVEWWIDAVRDSVGRWSERGPFPGEDSARRHLDDWAAEPPVYIAERADETPLEE
jgi:hypothetical protein